MSKGVSLKSPNKITLSYLVENKSNWSEMFSTKYLILCEGGLYILKTRHFCFRRFNSIGIHWMPEGRLCGKIGEGMDSLTYKRRLPLLSLTSKR